jgi:hypothetical protein
VTFFSCKVNEETKVKKVAHDFLVYFNNEDYDHAKKFGTDATGQFLDVMKTFASLDGNNSSAKKNLSIEIYSCNIKNDSALCQYTCDGKDEMIELVKINNRWLVDMRKEDPNANAADMAYADSVAAAQQALQDSIYNAEEAQRQIEDTVTFFDFCVTDLHNQNGSSALTLMLNNRSEYNINHLWFAVYFSDKNGKFMMKKEVMFDNVLRFYIAEGDSISRGNWERMDLLLEKVDADVIGEIFLIPIRIDVQAELYNYFWYEGEDIFDMLKEYVHFKNSSNKEIKLTF